MARALGFLSFVASFILFSLSRVHGLILPLEEWVQEKADISVGASVVNGTWNTSLFIEGIDNKRDLIYATSISLNGRRSSVVLDTGSADLWVNIPGFDNFDDTGIPLQLHYGDGTTPSGTVGFATFQMGSISINQQAFLHVTQITNSSLTPFNLSGILGLGFDTASHINGEIQARSGKTSALGFPVLHRYFIQNPRQPKVVAFRLTRSDVPDDKGGSTIAIGEYDSKFSAVTKSTKLPQFPADGDRWTTLLGGIYVGGRLIQVKSIVPGAPSGYATTLLDSGTSRAIFPIPIWDAIYSQIPQAAKYIQGEDSIWIVPCRTTTIVEFLFDGTRYAIHPLDLTYVSTLNLSATVTVTYCGSALRGLTRVDGDEFDIILGDSFLRNVYSAFNFGDSSSKGKPYIQLLSTLDVKQAVTQVTTIRGKQLEGRPRELLPADLIKRLPP